MSVSPLPPRKQIPQYHWSCSPCLEWGHPWVTPAAFMLALQSVLYQGRLHKRPCRSPARTPRRLPHTRNKVSAPLPAVVLSARSPCCGRPGRQLLPSIPWHGPASGSSPAPPLPGTPFRTSGQQAGPGPHPKARALPSPWPRWRQTLAEEGSLSRPPGAHTRCTAPETHLEADTHPAQMHPGSTLLDAAPQHARRACAHSAMVSDARAPLCTHSPSSTHTHTQVRAHASLRCPQQPGAKCPRPGTARSQPGREGVPENHGAPPLPPLQTQEPLSGGAHHGADSPQPRCRWARVRGRKAGGSPGPPAPIRPPRTPPPPEPPAWSYRPQGA